MDDCCYFIMQKRQISQYKFDEDDPRCLKIILRIALEIEYMIKKGCDTFIVRIDSKPALWFAESVLDFKRAYPQRYTRLIVIPRFIQGFRCNKLDSDRYERTILQADDTLQLSADSYDGYVNQGDEYMLTNSAHAIALIVDTGDAIKNTTPDTAVINLNRYSVERARVLYWIL